MLIYPQIDPILVSLGPLQVRWYGLMYVFGFLSAWLLASYRARQPNSGWTPTQVSDIIFYSALGVVIGGRVGYMLFYDFPHFLAKPWELLFVWQGGMSFHGGLIGVITAIWFYSRSIHKTLFEAGDFIAPLVPVGLGAGRIGNFINGELWGRVTDVPWGMVYPQAGFEPRHPSEIYEFFLEGVCFFLVLWIYSAKPRPRMAVSALFLIGYGSFRIIGEFFREPDAQYGYFLHGWLTMGQILSIPMVVVGCIIWWKAHHQTKLQGNKPCVNI